MRANGSQPKMLHLPLLLVILLWAGQQACIASALPATKAEDAIVARGSGDSGDGAQRSPGVCV